MIKNFRITSYDCLSQNGFQHFSVDNSENFVNPNDPTIQTQNVESSWSAIKRHLKKGTNVKTFMDEFILEYCYKKNLK